MKDEELRRERRRQQALDRLGCNKPRCFICGYDNPLALEKHHIAGRAFGDATTIVCRNCHRTLSDRQKDHSIGQANPPGELEPIRRFLLGLADFFEMLVDKLREFATKIATLDRGSNLESGEAKP